MRLLALSSLTFEIALTLSLVHLPPLHSCLLHLRSAPLPTDSPTSYILTSPIPSPIPTKAPPPPTASDDEAEDDDELEIGAELHEGDVVGKKRSAEEAELDEEEEGGEKKKKGKMVEYKELEEKGGVPAIEID